MAEREQLRDHLVRLEIAAAFLAGEIAREIAERREHGDGLGRAAGSAGRQDASFSPGAARDTAPADDAPAADPGAAAPGRRYSLAA